MKSEGLGRKAETEMRKWGNEEKKENWKTKKRVESKRNSNAPSPDTTGFSSLNTSTKSSSTFGGQVADNAIIGTLGYCVRRLCNLP
jgi:hypothetical protein